MLLFGFFLVPIVLAASVELKINDYDVNIEDNILKSIQNSKNSAPSQLKLSGLGIRDIDKNAFDNLEHLKDLDLSNNSLSTMPEFVFSNLTQLERLSLADNKISELANTFVGLNNLKTLNISNNPMIHLRKSYFFGLTKACDILTKGNEYYSINTELFENPFLRKDKLPTELLEEKSEDVPAVSNAPAARAVLDKNFRAKICIQDGTVKLLDVLTADETLANDCHDVKIDHDKNELSLRNLGISTFESGWYRLRNVAVDAIDLTNNNIHRVTRELLNDLPADVTYVNLNDNKIERLEKGIIENENLRRLNFKGNLISDIEDGTFEKTKLTGLYFLGNALRTTKFAATLPSTLTSLVLAKNAIAELTENAFAKLNQLQFISLAENNITELKSQSLRGLTSLQSLPLEKNNINRIEPGAFQDLKSLTRLSLNNNNIATLENGVFAGLEKIEIIYMSHNKLTKISRSALENLPETLVELNFMFNNIESLTAGTFVNVPKNFLNLMGNQISKIEKGSFDLPTLKGLDLGSNKLSELDGDSFDGLRNVRHISLMNNGIKKIEKGAAKNFGTLYNLDLSSNPIKRLENGALYGLQKSDGTYITLTQVPIELIQGGLFEDV